MHRLYFDGATQPNPGNSGVGFALLDGERVEVDCGCKNVGLGTNNEAEYKALLFGLERALAYGVQHLHAFGDSQLVVNQVKGEWSVGKEELKVLHREVMGLIAKFESFSISWIKRDENRRADELSKEGLHLLPGNPCSVSLVPATPSPQKAFTMRVVGKKVLFIEQGRVVVLDLTNRLCSCIEYKKNGSCKHILALKQTLGVVNG